MNSQESSTAAQAAATPIDWSDVIDGKDGLYELAVNLRHMLHYLDGDLDHSLDPARARKRYPAGFDLSFTEDGAEATKWLAGRAWSTANDLVEKLHDVQHALDAQGEK